MDILWVTYDQGFWFVVSEHPSACQSVFIAGKSEILPSFKMILQVIPKSFPILLLLGVSVVHFSTQNFFRSSQCISYALKTSPRNHSFATKWFRVSQGILIFLCEKSKSVIFTSLRQAVTIWKLAHMWNFVSFFDLRRFLKIFCELELHILSI